MIVALGGMFSERSGVVNLALEGIMIIGGFACVFYLNYMQSNDILHGLPLLLTGLLISGIVVYYLVCFMPLQPFFKC